METKAQKTKPDLSKEEACSSSEHFSCIISKKSADLIRNQAEYYGVSDGQALESLISVNSVSDPKLAAVLGIMNINHIIRYQSGENQLLTMSIIAGAIIGEITTTGKTLDEAINEAVKNIHELRRIIDNMKKEKDEDY